MIINVRGPHGSAKSTTVRRVMARGVVKPIFGLLGPRLPQAYSLELPSAVVPTCIIGPYTTDCGGCDRIPHNEIVTVLIQKYATRGHVLFEGSLISSAFGAVGALLERWGKDSAFVFLDTPLEQCIRRVETRRGRERDERLVNNVTLKFASGLRVRKKVERDGTMRSIVASSEDAPEVLLELLSHKLT